MLERLSDELPAIPEDSSRAVTAEPRTDATRARAGASLEQAEAELASVVESDPAEEAEEPGPEDYHFSAEDIEKVFIDARDWQRQYGARPGATQEPEPTESDDSQFVVDEPAGIEDITLEGLKVEIESENGESTHLEAEFDYIDDEEDHRASQKDEDAETGFYRALLEGRELPTGVASATTAASSASAPVAPLGAGLRATPADRWSEARRSRVDDDLPDLDLSRAPSPQLQPARLWLALGSGILILALAAQAAHYFRQDIVRHPQAGPALRRVYELIGQPLSPNWDLDAFEVRQWGPTVDVAPGAPLTVRASLTNRADHAQPYPLLRLEFEDRFGAAVAQRDFAPAEYLKSPPQATRQLAVGETTEAELSVVAPGTDAVGYRLEICLREERGRIRCAHGEG